MLPYRWTFSGRRGMRPNDNDNGMKSVRIVFSLLSKYALFEEILQLFDKKLYNLKIIVYICSKIDLI